MSLNEIRKKIDALDSQLIELLSARADLVHEVGEIKRAHDLAIYVPEREEELLQKLARKNHGRLSEIAIRAIYREIMSASLALEKGLTIAYFGPAATWTHQAAIQKFGASVTYAPEPTISDVFSAVSRSRADYGVVPIENSTEGAVNHTLDMFTDSEVKICAQILLPIEHNLLAKIPREKIERIYSHPQSFAQCRQWLRTNFPKAELIEVSSNARAAEMAVSESNAAAVAPRLAAEVYHLDILESGIQDSAHNTTRFLVIGRHSCQATGNDKTSIMFSLQDKPGSLFEAIAPFKELRLNMSKIESRPSKRKAWEYFFFVDVDGHADDPNVIAALDELQKHCTFVKILGSYPKGSGAK